MSLRAILFVALDPALSDILDDGFRRQYRCVVVWPGNVPAQLEAPETFSLLVVSGYSLQEPYKVMPELETLISSLPGRLPRLYLLHSTDPSLSLVPLKGDQRFFYLRGPLSLRALKPAVDQILAMKPRPVRFQVDPSLGIVAEFQLTVAGQTIHFRKEVSEISPKGFSLRWEIANPLIYPGDILEDLVLRAQTGIFLNTRAQVKHLTPLRVGRRTDAIRVGVEFMELQHESPQATDSRSIAFLTDPLVIRTVLGDAVERRTSASLRSQAHTWESHAMMTSADEAQGLLTFQLSELTRADDISIMDILTCQFVRDNAQLQFSCVLTQISDDRSVLVVRFPRRLDRLWARSTLRYTFAGERAPVVEIYSPVKPDEPMRREVLNLSPNGLSFWADPERDLVFRHMLLDRIELTLPTGLRLTLKGEVRYIGQRESGPPGEGASSSGNGGNTAPRSPSAMLIETSSPGPLPGDLTTYRAHSEQSAPSDPLHELKQDEPDLDSPQSLERIPCGIRFEGMTAEQHAGLVSYLIHKNFPQIVDAQLEDEELLWQFLEKGEFYTAPKREECLGTPDEVRTTQARMLLASSGLSRKLLFKDQGQIYGTVSLQQVYSQTWLVHHLCAVRHPSEFVPKNLLLFLGEYISKTPEVRYIKMMWRPNNTWSNKMFGRLVHRLHDGEQSVVKVYTYLHWHEESLPPVHLAEREWHIRLIEPEEVVELESFFISQEEYFLMKSEDLIRGGLGIEKLGARYQQLNLFRERQVLVAMEAGRLVGFALLERSSPGLNLSNLLSTCQIHINLSDPIRAKGLKRALIRHTIEHYLSYGQKRVIMLTEDRDLAAYEAMGFTKVKEYVSWTFDHSITNIYNLYCYYIFRLYERLEARRRARHTYYHGSTPTEP